MRDNQVFSVVQSSADTLISQTATTPYLVAYAYSFQNLDQFAVFAGVFDQYRFDEIEVAFRPMYTANPLGSAAITIVPSLYVVVDYDDFSTPSNIAYLREYSNCSISQYETVVRRFTPHIALAAYTGSFNGYQNAVAPWCDAAAYTIQHYGVKVGIDPGIVGQTALQSWTVTTRFRVSFRNVH
jgi:hypothetical protein